MKNIQMKKLGLVLISIVLIFSNCSDKSEIKKNEEPAGSEFIKPNLLIIQTDEHSFRTLGCYREHLSHKQAYIWGDGNNVETPNIDFLAKNGALFTKFYAATPVCTPSRGSLITGMYPQNTGTPKNDMPLNDGLLTFASVLKENGYKTGFIGKWHLDGPKKPGWDPERNFGFEDNRYMYNRGHWKKMEDTDNGPQVAALNAKGKPSTNLDGADEESFTTDFLTKKTIDFIKENRDTTFSMYLSFPDPHGPDKVREPYSSMYTGMNFKAPPTYNVKYEDAPGWAKPAKRASLNHAQYFGMVKCIDDNIGKILDYLRKEELLDKTIVIFTSDHGDLRAEHHRHNKGNPFETSAKVPFVISYPPLIPKGAVINNAFNTVDFAPTILNFMGMEIPDQMVGRDFSNLLINPDAQDSFEDIAFMRSVGNPGEGSWIAAVTSRYKLVLSKNDIPWLIDMETDPDELVNFATDSEYDEVVSDLANKLHVYAKEQNDPFLQGTKMADDLERLIK